MDMVSYNFSRISIGHQAQINKTRLGGQIGDIGYPDLFGGLRNNLITSRFKQVRVSSKSMMAVSGFVVSAFARNQLTVLSEDIKEPVSSGLQGRVTALAHQPMQLACTQAGLMQAHFTNKIQYALSLLLTLISMTNPFVISLRGNSQKLASPGNRQTFDLPLFEDLPDRFFTTVTP